MAIFLFYFYALNVWADAFLHPTNSLGFAVFILLPGLPFITVAIWYLLAQRPVQLLNSTQQLLRASAGQDELLVRELEKPTDTSTEPNQSG